MYTCESMETGAITQTNVVCTGTSTIRISWTLSLSIFCKTLVVDEKFLTLAIDRG